MGLNYVMIIAGDVLLRGILGTIMAVGKISLNSIIIHGLVLLSEYFLTDTCLSVSMVHA